MLCVDPVIFIYILRTFKRIFPQGSNFVVLVLALILSLCSQIMQAVIYGVFSNPPLSLNFNEVKKILDNVAYLYWEDE